MNKTDGFREFFAEEDVPAIRSKIGASLTSPRREWLSTINALEMASMQILGRYWLKRLSMLLSVFGASELLGTDLDIFDVLRSYEAMEGFEHLSDYIYERTRSAAQDQLAMGGSTLFFSIQTLSSTRAATIIPELVQARYRETAFVLEEIDTALHTLNKDWIDVSRLWRTTNGFRLLRSMNHGFSIHVGAYRSISETLLDELGVNRDMFKNEC
jgi:hypothetical protein